jgi:menaquinone-9 beta-reductase
MQKYDVGIIGAGIAGSCLAILLADAGKKVIVFEKEKLPVHKVCGEFVSLESYEFLRSLGLPLDEWKLPVIKKLRLTSQCGVQLSAPLEVGGFGISRSKLDYELAQQMIRSGVTFCDGENVLNVQNQMITTTKQQVAANLVVGCHGKYKARYSNASRRSIRKNFVGVKYHIKGGFDDQVVSLHGFNGGYCGMSKIEDDLYCLCYLIDAKLVKQYKGDIGEVEKNVLYKNDHLQNVFNEAHFVWEKPLVISNITFSKHLLFDGETLFLGDAAGSISPLSGNGMSIAAKSALLLSQLMGQYTEIEALVHNYEANWDFYFGKKIKKAEWLNHIMLNPKSHALVLLVLKLLKPLRSKVIRDMQGDFFVRNTKLIR